MGEAKPVGNRKQLCRLSVEWRDCHRLESKPMSKDGTERPSGGKSRQVLSPYRGIAPTGIHCRVSGGNGMVSLDQLLRQLSG